MRSGMAWNGAVDAITSVPAEVFGMGNRGMIAVGAAANLVAWTGDPLELLSVPTMVMIGGRSVELKSRQTELLEKYRKLPGSPQVGLELPKGK